ncbi:chaperonin 10-like protein [Tricladium varicosporioides]|nr:chaperonin 10-like protein [Hymenoscyphus varicosporioides]
MKEAVVSPDIKVTIKDVPVPKPNADQVLIRVIYSGSNPKDWKRPKYMKKEHNSGDDIAGIIEEVGENITEFKKGDRVAAFHEMMSDHGSFAEYAIAWAYTTFHLPKKTSFEEGATVPLAAMTAAVGLYQCLRLPEPWNATTKKTPLIVYGASGAVGAFTIKLARLSNIHPIIAISGRGHNFVEGLIDRKKGDTIVDYRNGNEAIISGIKDTLKANDVSEVYYAFDAVSEHSSYQNISQVLSTNGKSKITLVLPGNDYSAIPKHIERSTTMVGSVHMAIVPDSEEGKEGIITGGKEFGFIFFRFFSRGLQEGWFTSHPYEVVPGGLRGVEKGLNDLMNGVNSATKYVFKIEDTK